jgi:hypothetical protein
MAPAIAVPVMIHAIAEAEWLEKNNAGIKPPTAPDTIAIGNAPKNLTVALWLSPEAAAA